MYICIYVCVYVCVCIYVDYRCSFCLRSPHHHPPVHLAEDEVAAIANTVLAPSGASPLLQRVDRRVIATTKTSTNRGYKG